MAHVKERNRFVGSLEAMLYAFFFVVALALVGTLFGVSLLVSQQAAKLERAVELASDAAARFAADPTATQDVVTEQGLRVVCEVDLDPQAFGWLHRGTVRVFDGNELIYELASTRYVSARDGEAW